MLDALLEKRIVVVTGKGGTGKTTISTLVARKAAQQGQRVLLTEVGGAQQVPRLFGRPGTGYRVQSLEPNLDTFSITPEESLEDYVVMQVRFKSIYRLVFRNRIIAPFMDAVPGLPDLMTLGKLFDLERSTEKDGSPTYDLIVLDAPSTGHALTLLQSPQSMMEMTGAGPVHENAKDIHALFTNPAKTGLLLAAVPETLPVNETIELFEALGAQNKQVAATVLNKAWPKPLSDLKAWDLARGALQSDDRHWNDCLSLCETSIKRAVQTDTAASTLQANIDRPLIQLPALPTRDMDTQHLTALQVAFEEASP